MHKTRRFGVGAGAWEGPRGIGSGDLLTVPYGFYPAQYHVAFILHGYCSDVIFHLLCIRRAFHAVRQAFHLLLEVFQYCLVSCCIIQMYERREQFAKEFLPESVSTV